MALLELNDVRTFFKTKRGIVKAVNGVSYSLDSGKVLGLVGESGSGKSVSAMSVLRLLDENGYIAGGDITFDGKDLVHLSKADMYKIRGNDISVISAHTNLDKAEGGVNDALALKLGLRDIQSVESDDPEESGLGRIGSVSETDIRTFALHVKESLSADGVEFSGKVPVKNVCVVGGSGGSVLLDAKKAGADTLVTGEAKYNQFADAIENGMNLVVAGHYHTENVVLESLKDYILSTLNDVSVEIFNCKFTEKV